ncbi:MAG TPA: hypothetical protein HA236_03660 [Candidatus Nitrosotenuis sp.]|jgi:hypothetical protein|nr:hypothetical protein [Candidatus Nitrosotenuis sp.]
MAKQDIKRLLEQANSALESEHDTHVESIRADLKKFKSNSLDKISKSTS